MLRNATQCWAMLTFIFARPSIPQHSPKFQCQCWGMLGNAKMHCIAHSQHLVAFPSIHQHSLAFVPSDILYSLAFTSIHQHLSAFNMLQFWHSPAFHSITQHYVSFIQAHNTIYNIVLRVHSAFRCIYQHCVPLNSNMIYNTVYLAIAFVSIHEHYIALHSIAQHTNSQCVMYTDIHTARQC